MANGTFLVANLRDYVRFNQQRGNVAAAELDGDFAELAKSRIEAQEGTVCSRRSGEIVAVFDSGAKALRAAVEMQKGLSTNLDLPVAIGLAEGSYAVAGTVHVLMALTLAERLSALANDGDILAVDALTRSVGRFEAPLVHRGLGHFNGIEDDVNVFQVVWN